MTCGKTDPVSVQLTLRNWNLLGRCRGREQATGNREQEVPLPRFLLKTLEIQGGSDYS